jgi:hypothetical protein
MIDGVGEDGGATWMRLGEGREIMDVGRAREERGGEGEGEEGAAMWRGGREYEGDRLCGEEDEEAEGPSGEGLFDDDMLRL